MNVESLTDARRLRFGAFEADMSTGELFEAGRRVKLPNQSFIALATLLERPGELVTRDELRARVWPDGRVVEFEQGLNAIMNRLREALGDSADNARFIETLPRRGYRFIAPVEATSQDPAPPPVTNPSSSPEAVSPPAPTPRSSKRWVLIAGVMLIALGASMTWFWGQGRPAETVGRQVVPFTSLVGQEVGPTFSPDGSQVAFAWNGGESGRAQFDLYVKAVDSERVLRLTHHPSTAISAAWSPNGASIAFTRQADDDLGLYLIPALGGPERRLAYVAFGAETFMPIAWSPDSKVLAYSTLNSQGRHEVRLLTLATLESHALTTVSECYESGTPAFSPDGEQLAFICMPSIGVYGIYLAKLPAGEPRLLANMLGNPRGIAWSADGTRLLISNEAGDGGALWSLSLDGEISRLPFGEEAIGPGIAVRGDRIAYVRGTQVIDIWRTDLTATEPTAAASKLISSSRVQLLPQYSPDGARIIFQSMRSGSPEIWIAEADGTNPTRLTSFNGPLTGAPVWCSDGKRIAFDSRASGLSGVYVLNVDERVPRLVKTTRENLSLPTWSEDCRWLFASDGKSALYRIPADGGQAERITEQPSYYATVAGDQVIFNVTNPKGVTLWSRNVNGGPEAPLEGLPTLAYADSWTATPSGIYFFAKVENEAAALHVYDFTTRTTRRLVSLPHAPTPLGGLGISVSRDGRWLLYTLSGESQSDILLAQPRGASQ